MEAMRESWTDDRLDDLNGKVDALRLETRTEFKAIRGEMKEEFGAIRGEMKAEFGAVRGEMKAGFDKIDERFEKMNERLLQIYRTMLWFCGVAMAALIGFIATQI
jgi:predicted  nucleic acid-binding Zn-ribbon protein